jgi:predicted acyltransferase
MKNAINTSQGGGKGRLLSLDALRGFDMLWITGGGAFITTLARITDASWVKALAEQMDHVVWNGFHFYDLIFPLFMFISGIAIPFSVKSALSKNPSKNKLVFKFFKRMIILIILGILYNGVFREGFANARYASVLGQIGIAYFFASVIYIFTGSLKSTIYWIAGILAGVSVMQLFVPVPGVGAGVFTPEGCINGYIDRLYLPGRLSYGPEGMISGNGIYDALGILSVFSAIGITLMGIIAGKILQDKTFSEYRKTALLAATGAILIPMAILISPVYPIIKVCWTTTYNLLAGGISFLLIALFYLIIDVWGYRKWSFFFRIIGMNSIFIYLFVRVVPVGNIVGFFTGWIIKPMGDIGPVIAVLFNIAAEWMLLYYMYKKEIFVKV